VWTVAAKTFDGSAGDIFVIKAARSHFKAVVIHTDTIRRSPQSRFIREPLKQCLHRLLYPDESRRDQPGKLEGKKMIEAAAARMGSPGLREAYRTAGKFLGHFVAPFAVKALELCTVAKNEAAFEPGSLLKSISNLKRTGSLQARPKNDTQPQTRMKPAGT